MAASVLETASALSLAEHLDTYARVAVEAGLGLRPGQELLITAPLEAAPLVRRITEYAYRAGAVLVPTMYGDAAATLARAQDRLRASGFAVDYLALVHGQTMQVAERLEPGTRLIAAARLGSVRLLDNVAV